MKVHQVKPEYTKIVAAIPHSVSEAHYWQWQDTPGVKEACKRWTDWFTDELFGSEMDGVAVVKAKVSRFDCDVERQEGEPDRLCRFLRERNDEQTREWVLANAMYRNRYLAEWFRYRAEILDAASEGVPLIIDCHSFPSDLAPDVDVCVGFNEDSSKPSKQTIDLVVQTFRNAGYAVAFNHPYANALAPVGYIGHSVMIEVNKHTYMDETALQKNSGFEKLKSTIDSLYQELLWMRLNMPRNFSCPWGYPANGSSEARSAAWETIKSSIVKFTAARYGVAMPKDISDTDPRMAAFCRKAVQFCAITDCRVGYARHEHFRCCAPSDKMLRSILCFGAHHFIFWCAPFVALVRTILRGGQLGAMFQLTKEDPLR